MGNVIIYPTGTTGNSDPHIVFDDDTAKLQFNVKSTGALSLSSATVSAGFEISNTNITTSGASITGGVTYFGGVPMINSVGVWIGPK